MFNIYECIEWLDFRGCGVAVDVDVDGDVVGIVGI